MTKQPGISLATTSFYVLKSKISMWFWLSSLFLQLSWTLKGILVKRELLLLWYFIWKLWSSYLHCHVAGTVAFNDIPTKGVNSLWIVKDKHGLILLLNIQHWPRSHKKILFLTRSDDACCQFIVQNCFWANHQCLTIPLR